MLIASVRCATPAAYVQPCAVLGTRYPTWPGRQVTAEMLQEDLDAAVRHRDV